LRATVSFFLSLGFAILSFTVAPALAADAGKYDVLVVGAGLGGSAAAIQAARMGARVALLEETDWIGGQATASAVSTLDDVGRTRTGIYRELVERIRSRYAAEGRGVSTCLWGSDTVGCEPSVLRDLLRGMMKEASSGPGSVDLLLRTRVIRAVEEGGALVGIVAETPQGELLLRAPVTIEATECGDLLGWPRIRISRTSPTWSRFGGIPGPSRRIFW
jgi:flavin-dependent dehydrogenase